MGKSENYLFFGNYCSLRSQSCLRHSAESVYELSEYQRSRSLRFQCSNLFFSKTVGRMEPNFIGKLKGEWE